VILLTDEKIQESPVRKWMPVIAIVIAVALIGVYYLAVFLPGQQVQPAIPENDAVLLPTADATLPHTIEFTNNCDYPVWVDILGGKQFSIPGTNDIRAGACGCYQEANDPKKPLLCSPTTKCDNTFCGPDKNLCNQGTPLVDNGGFYLAPAGGTHTSTVIASWQGNFWGRTGCTGTPDDFTCEIGTCVKLGTANKGQLECGGSPALGPLTKGEFNFDEGGHDTYDVSLVDGYNVPMSVKPKAGTFSNDGTVNKDFDCTESAADTNLIPLLNTTKLDPAKLLVYSGKKVVGIGSACYYADKVGDPKADQYCCRGDYHLSTTCKPETWPADIQTAQFFKKYNPKAYSFAYNDASSTYQCKNKDKVTSTTYQVAFCPAKKAGGESGAATPGQAAVQPPPTGTVVTTQPTPTAPPTQTAVPQGPYNPGSSGGINY
jgi:hypothetical protein